MDRPDVPARPTVGVDLGAFAVVCAAGAAALHLAMAPGRADASLVAGAVLVACAAAQLWCAARVRATPPGDAWRPVVLVEALVVGGWLAAWTAGVPGGSRAGAEPVDLAALVGCALAGLVLVTGLVAAVSPAAVVRARAGDTRASTRTAAVLVAAATVAAVLGDGSLAGRDDEVTVAGAAPTTSRAPGARVAGLEDMPGATLLLPGETVPSTRAGAVPTTTVVAPSTTAADRGFAALGGGRRVVDDVALDASTRAALAAQLAGTAALVVAYPTVAAAEAAGYRRAGPFSPGIGAPYAPPRPPGNLDGRIDAADVADAVLLFGGTSPAARLVGFEFLSTRARTDGEPDGFAGPNDHWSYALDVCRTQDDRGVARTPLGIDRSVTRAQCDALGGTLVPLAWWYVRAWVVPGYDTGSGAFRELNPSITCPDGGYEVRPLDQLGSGDSLCR